MTALLLPFALALAASQASPAADTDEAIYLRRFAQYANGPNETYYDPMEAIRGRPGAADALPRAMRPTLAGATLARMRDYAFARNSRALLIWRDGKLEAQYYAPGDGPATLLNAKSLAKPLSAIAIGRAIRMGAIASLDQSASDFISEWRGTAKAAITIRQLLNMTSGLLEQGFSKNPDNIWSRAYLHPEHDRIMIQDYPLAIPPGTQFGYSNVSGDLIALIVERATGKRYAAFLSEEVLRPIGAAGGTIWIDRPGGLAHSGCCTMLPAQTFLRLGLLLMDDGVVAGKRLLPPGYVAEMRTGTPQNPRYGLGVWLPGDHVERRGFGRPGQAGGAQVLHSEPYLANDLFLFDGNSDQVLYMVPSRRLAILRLGNQPPETREWDNAALPNLALRDLMAAR